MFFSEGAAQTTLPSSPSLERNANGLASLKIPSNSISHIVIRGTDIWIGTGKGAALTADGARNFNSFRYVPQFPRPSIFAIDVKGDTIWCSTGFTKETDAGNVQTGTGYAYSFNNGATWSSAPQPMDPLNDSLVTYGINTVRFIPIVVPEQNVTFDLAAVDSTVWVASWSSGLRKSTDRGSHWTRIVLPSSIRNSIAPTDTLVNYLIDPRLDNNFLLFSVFTEDNQTVWAGSAGGVNKSTDGGSSWSKFTVNNQSQPILGNWVIAIKGQRLGSRSRIWITNWPAEGANEKYGVSATDDSGRTWKTSLAGIKAYDFAFKDSITYVATEQGLYRSSDGGESWSRSGTIIDPASGNTLATSVFFAAGVIADSVYGGTADGLVKTIDNATHPFGQQWEVQRTFQPVGSAASAYAYPNPFSPKLGAQRIHYSTGGVSTVVTIEVFDFGMNRVRTVIRDAQRDGSREHDELWDGRTDDGTVLPNGVYFFRVTTGGGDPAWGKVMVIQ
jgi:photosystem II stability/assembly factor-like uncharacterized protein